MASTIEPGTAPEDPRIGRTIGYETTEDALADLDEAERTRYLYIERARLRSYLQNENYDPASVPILRAVSHDEAIRNVEFIRKNGPPGPIVWDDVAKDEEREEG